MNDDPRTEDRLRSACTPDRRRAHRAPRRGRSLAAFATAAATAHNGAARRWPASARLRCWSSAWRSASPTCAGGEVDTIHARRGRRRDDRADDAATEAPGRRDHAPRPLPAPPVIAVWPPAGHDHTTVPYAAATVVRRGYIGFAGPTFGEFREGEPGVGEIDVFETGESGQPRDDGQHDLRRADHRHGSSPPTGRRPPTSTTTTARPVTLATGRSRGVPHQRSRLHLTGVAGAPIRSRPPAASSRPSVSRRPRRLGASFSSRPAPMSPAHPPPRPVTRAGR